MLFRSLGSFGIIFDPGLIILFHDPLLPPPPPPSSSQLEESEFTCAAAVKARKGMELEIEDLHIQMEDVVKVKISVSLRGGEKGRDGAREQRGEGDWG